MAPETDQRLPQSVGQQRYHSPSGWTASKYPVFAGLQLGNIAPDFKKIDVEGFEWPVLQGATSWFGPSKMPPIIMIEVQADHDEIAAWMHDRGYTLFDIHGQVLTAIPHSTMNLFALNRDHHAAQLARWIGS